MKNIKDYNDIVHFKSGEHKKIKVLFCGVEFSSDHLGVTFHETKEDISCKECKRILDIFRNNFK